MIHVNSCGHDSHHPKPCNIEHKKGVPDYLPLLIKQESWIMQNNAKHPIHPNAVICFPPQTYIHYGCDKIGYNDDWIHFTLNDQELPLFLALKLPMCQVLYPYDFHCLSEYVRLLSDNFHSSSSFQEQITDALMRTLLYSLKDSIDKDFQNPLIQKHYQGFSRLRTQIYNNPAASWTVPSLADSLNISLSYFQHLYQSFFHCSCQQDIISARLNLSKYYLTSTDMGIGEIADFCGYENDLHYMRQFKKFVGMTPTAYRQRHPL